MRALVSERRGCKANRYVLVSTGDLQPRDAEWKDIALRRQDGRVEEQLSGCSTSRSSADRCAGPFNEFSGLQFLGKVRVCFLQTCQLNLRSYQKARRCDQLDLPTSMHMRTTMLQINHSNHVPARQQWHGKKSFVAILWQFVEQPEAWIPGCILSYGNRLRVFGHLSCDSLPHAQFQAIYDFRVRSFRCRSTSSSPSSM
jgi:hypothetical protein